MPTTASKALGARIKSARLRKGLSQEALAEAIGSSRRNVMRWEGGHNEPRLLTIAAIAGVTEQPLEFFAQESDSSPESRAVEDALGQFLGCLYGAVREEVQKCLAAEVAT
jgi:transcriptional regulator with XRE-family HTH domain